jgi:hypothetical protein
MRGGSPSPPPPAAGTPHSGSGLGTSSGSDFGSGFPSVVASLLQLAQNPTGAESSTACVLPGRIDTPGNAPAAAGAEAGRCGCADCADGGELRGGELRGGQGCF